MRKRKQEQGEGQAVGEKKCLKCGQIKPLTEFHKHPQGSGGRTNKCKDCASEYNKARHQKLKQIQEGDAVAAAPRAVGDLASKDEDFKTVKTRLSAWRARLRGIRGRKAGGV